MAWCGKGKPPRGHGNAAQEWKFLIALGFMLPVCAALGARSSGYQGVCWYGMHPHIESQSPVVPVPVGIYARVSTETQASRKFDSCEHQIILCREHIKKQAHLGWHEAACYSDQAYSGGDLNRLGVRALMADIETGRVKVVLVYKLERILRSTFEWSRFSRFLDERGCRLLSPSEDLSDASASGKLKTNILMSFAEYERLNVVEKIRSKMHAQARRGMWGGGYIPFGYSYDREKQELHLDPDEAPIVRRIFQRARQNCIPSTRLSAS